MRSLRRKKDVEMLLQYMTEIMFYQSGSRLPACALVETCKLLHEWLDFFVLEGSVVPAKANHVESTMCSL